MNPIQQIHSLAMNRYLFHEKSLVVHKLYIESCLGFGVLNMLIISVDVIIVPILK